MEGTKTPPGVFGVFRHPLEEGYVVRTPYGPRESPLSGLTVLRTYETETEAQEYADRLNAAPE